MSDIIDKAFKPRKGNKLLIEIEFTNDTAMQAFAKLWGFHQSGEDVFDGVKVNAICFHGVDPYQVLEIKRQLLVQQFVDFASSEIERVMRQ